MLALTEDHVMVDVHLSSSAGTVSTPGDFPRFSLRTNLSTEPLPAGIVGPNVWWL